MIMAQTTNYSPSPQPNYHRLGQIHRELADELTKISNTPQSEIVQQLDRKIDTAVQQMNKKIDGLSQQIRIRYI
jgi:chemotaxis protein histidine kinase CheA